MRPMLKHKLLTGILSLCMAAAVMQTDSRALAADGPNLLANPGFEQELGENGEIPGWTISAGTFSSDGSFKPGMLVEVTDRQQSGGAVSLYMSDSSGTTATVVYSDAIEVSPGDNCVLKYKAYGSTGSVSAAVRFYRSSADAAVGGQITSQSSAVTASAEVWTENTIEAQAPEEALYARVLFYTIVKSSGSAYVDDVYFGLVQQDPGGDIQYTVENLGTQIHSVSISRTVFGQDASGRLLAYSLVNGTPCSLVVTDVANEQVLAQLPIEDTVNGRTYTTTPTNRGLSVMPDGTVYICGSPTYMFKYVPGSPKVEFVRTTLGTQTFDMKPGPDGLLFVGTYSSTVAFEFDTVTEEVRSLGQIMPEETYVYSLAYDEENNDIYFGIGAHAHLIKYDRDTGVKTEIPLPEAYTVGKFVWDLKVVEGKLFMRFSPGGTVVYDINTQTFDSTGLLEVTSRFFSEKSPVDNKVYFTTNDNLGYYDLNDKTYTITDKQIEGYGTGFHFATLNEPGYPGYTLVGVTRYGRLFKYNLETGNHRSSILGIRGEPTTLQNVSRANDGRIHISGYLTGGTAIYDPVTGAEQEYSNQTLGLGQSIAQSDVQFQYKDKTLYATYPGARVYLYDPVSQWNLSSETDPNPEFLFSAYGVGEQDRIFAGCVIEEENKVVVGTVPKYGLLGGALAVYDFDTGQTEIYWNIIPNQSITAVAYKDGFIYGGSNIWGGLGIDAVETEAKLFIWDMENEEVVFETVPVAGKRGITAMIVGPDGKIWGNAEGYLFIFNPETRQVEYTGQVGSASYGSAVWRDAVYEIGTDGNVYCTQGSKFFKIDAQTREITNIRDTGKKLRFTQDDFGNFYLRDEIELYKLTIPELILRPTGAVMTIAPDTLESGETADIAITGLLERGGSVNYLERREVQYFSSDSSIAVVENGAVKAVNPGEVEIWAVVDICGEQFETNRVEITVPVTIEYLQDTLNGSIEAGNIDNALAAQLTNSLSRAVQQKDKEGLDKAVKCMEDFIKHLNTPALDKFINQATKTQLDTYAHALIEQWGL